MKIPFCEPFIEPDLPQVVADQVASGWWGPGSIGNDFLGSLMSRVGMEYGVLTVSGTMALSLAAECEMRIFPAIVPAYGVIAVPNAFATMGFDLVLKDIDRETGCMSPATLAQEEGDGPVCFVDFSGYRGPVLEQARDIVEAAGNLFIEDASCAIPKFSNSEIVTYSFSMPKWITTGQGGAVFTNDACHWQEMDAYTDHGGGDWRFKNINRRIGNNLRMSAVLAAIGDWQLDNLDERIARKTSAYRALKARLGDKLFDIPNSPPLHNILFAQHRDALIGRLNEQGIEARWQYRTISQHPCYKHLAGHYPNADWWTEHAVYLPFGMALTPEQAEVIADAVLASGEELVENR